MPWRSKLENLFPGLCRFNTPLAPLNSWGVGGPAECLVTPITDDSISLLFHVVKEHALPLWFLGGGTNVLIPDKGLPGVTLHTGLLDQIIEREGRFTCGAGVPLKTLLGLSSRHGFTGLEFAAGIPGTLGGALIGNAGTSGRGVGDLVDWAKTIEPDGDVKMWRRGDLTFAYRKSNLNNPGQLILNCEISLQPGVKSDIAMKIREHMVRRSRQPHGRGTAGCVFKNPGPLFAGKLLEDCGCKGMTCGSVAVSERHTNFFINRGNARASDIWELIFKCRQKVLEHTGIDLSLEVKLLGESWQ